ncbi:hypothetical protein LCGC14_2307530 [marine sediment metagenome]|uniref:Uncharacterized protein n=1 Tax=marine sediment metagenome TaxID=412755 RepID=A0A0F9D950_9ZZZZ
MSHINNLKEIGEKYPYHLEKRGYLKALKETQKDLKKCGNLYSIGTLFVKNEEAIAFGEKSDEK